MKTIRIAVVAAALSLSANVFAADEVTTMTRTGVIDKVANCTTLSANVTIQLSDGVIAAYDCGPNTVLAGTCHTSGTNKSQDFDCTYLPTTDDSGNPIAITQDGCPDWDGVTGEQPEATYTNVGRTGFSGGSGGGSVRGVGLGAATCDTGTVVKLVSQ